MGGNNIGVMGILLLIGVVLLGISIAFIRVYWFGKGLPPEMAEKRPGKQWLDQKKGARSSEKTGNIQGASGKAKAKKKR